MSGTPRLAMSAGSAALAVARAKTIPARARITHWLLSGGVQRPDGAVAGWVDARGRAAYVYPEIAGYYLEWLAWRASQGGDRAPLAARARAVQHWLHDWITGDQAPLTRVYATAGTIDWRNQAVFTFDLAMALRGLSAAVQCRIAEPDAVVVAGLCRELDALTATDGHLDACRIHRQGPEFPERWSTRRGPFLAKAAAGIEHAAAALHVAPTLRAAAARTFDASLDALGDSPHAETHPLLYAIEGFLAWPDHPRFMPRLPMVAARFDRLAERIEALGRVPEAMDAPGAERLDIVAQTLRAGVLLGQHRGAAMHERLCRALVATLDTATTPEGAVPFVHTTTAAQFNVWVAMFASQALSWAHLDGPALRRVAAAPCIV